MTWSEGLGIHRTYPYPAYGGLAPVPGGQGEQRDDIADPTAVLRQYQGPGPGPGRFIPWMKMGEHLLVAHLHGRSRDH